MNENMNRFDFNTEGKICDYGCEEPKVLTEQEILEELNHLENTKNHFLEECEDVNCQNECLQEELDKAIVPKFKPHSDLFVIVVYEDEPNEPKIKQYYIDEIVIRGDGKYIEYRDIEKRTIIGENNLLFATEEEARAKLKEVQNEQR